MNTPDVVEFWLQPPALHSLAVHFPIVLAIAGVPLVFVAAAIATGSQALRTVALFCYVLMSGMAFLAAVSGERARELLPGDLPGEVWSVVYDHEYLASRVWILGAVTAALLFVSLVNVRWLRVTGITLAMIGSLVTAGWVGVTGHYGGRLVYEHGLGFPSETAAPRLEPVTARDLDVVETLPDPVEVETRLDVEVEAEAEIMPEEPVAAAEDPVEMEEEAGRPDLTPEERLQEFFRPRVTP